MENNKKCNHIKELEENFNWFSFVDEETGEVVKCMPVLTSYAGQKMRVNHCPVCGEYIRNIQIRNQ